MKVNQINNLQKSQQCDFILPDDYTKKDIRVTFVNTTSVPVVIIIDCADESSTTIQIPPGENYETTMMAIGAPLLGITEWWLRAFNTNASDSRFMETRRTVPFCDREPESATVLLFADSVPAQDG